MARASPYQGNFSGGEWSPFLHGRKDADRYAASLDKLENEICTLQGALTRRAGTKFVDPAKNNAYTRLIPFKFSTTQNYVLEFGANYIRFFANRAPVETAPSVPLELATPYGQADIPAIKLKYAQSLDVVYITCPGFAPRKLQRFSALVWQLDIIDFQDGPYLKPNTTAAGETYVDALNGRCLLTCSAATGSTTMGPSPADLTVSAVANNGAGLVRLTINSSANLRDNDVVDVFNMPVGTVDPVLTHAVFNIIVIDATHIDLKRSTVATVGAAAGNINFALFHHAQVGQHVRALEGTIWGWGKITSVTNDRVAVVKTVNTFTDNTTKAVWRFGVWNDYLGWPICVNFHEDRLYFAGAAANAQRVDGSNISDYENFAPSSFASNSTTDNTTILATAAVSFTLNSNDGNPISWMNSDEKGMPMGTSGGPWILRPSILNEAVTPTNISAKKVNNIGSSEFAAVLAGKSSIFVDFAQRKVLELSYFYDVDGFRSVDLSELAEHIPATGIATELVFQKSPINIIWGAKADGTLIGITYDRTLDALRTGWHRHFLGGRSDIANNPPVVESLAVIPAPDGKSDDVWMSVKRYINGTTFRSIEYMTKIFEGFDDQQDAYFVDCGITYDVPIALTNMSQGAVTTITKVAHGLITGDKVRFQHISGLQRIADNGDRSNVFNGPLYDVTLIDADHFSVDVDSTAFSAFINDGAAVYRKMVSTLSGLDWLDGEEVSILADGAVLPKETVVAGAITLSNGAGVVQVGLGYSTKIKQLRLEAGASDGTSFGKNRRINETAFMMYRTGPFEYGMNFEEMFDLDLRTPEDNMDQAPPLFTGIIDRQTLDSDYDLDNQLCIRQDDPIPLTLLAIMPQLVTYDKG